MSHQQLPAASAPQTWQPRRSGGQPGLFTRLPESLEALDTLLLTVRIPLEVQRDGIHLERAPVFRPPWRCRSSRSVALFYTRYLAAIQAQPSTTAKIPDLR